ncbi:MAG: adenosylcobinamide-GDP ribazoletransferase [Jatrophihabitantaceae bacterium]
MNGDSHRLRAAFGAFSVLPVRAAATAPAGRVVLWLPVVGVVLGALAYLPALAVWRGHGHGTPLLAAALVVATLAVLTRGLHLDGTADLADGLGSRLPAEQARAVMRAPDVGAFGVVAVCCTLLVQVAALAGVLAGSSRVGGLVAIIVATTTGRVAVVRAAGRPAAPASAFGALVAGAVGLGARWTVTAGLLGAAALAGAAGNGPRGSVWSVAACITALLVAELLCRHAARRLGGVSGDVFGALVEVAGSATLIVLAAGVAWR